MVYINYDGTIDIEFDYIDYWGDKEKDTEYNVDIADVRLMTRGRRALERDAYISPAQQKNIEDNEKIIERIKDKEDSFEDALSVKSDALYRHQKAGTLLADMYDKFAFFYDTGTGKTVMTLDIIASKQEKDDARFLIIAPKSIIKTAWMDDAENFYPELRILPLYKGFTDDKKKNLLFKWKKGKDYDVSSPYVKLLHAIFGVPSILSSSEGSVDEQLQEMAHHYIINSELFIRNPQHYISSLGINGIVMDESAVLKNYRGKTSETMREITADMKYVYLLSGKPAPNNVVEYFSQMKIVDPETFHMTYDRFLGMFCYGPQNNMIEANKKLFAEMVSVRSLIISKKDCLDLPDCVDLVRQIELPVHVMNDYEALYRECMAIIKGMDSSEVFYSTQSKLAVLMKLRQMASGFFISERDGYRETRDIIDVHNEKLKELNDILDQLEDEQVIIWGQFQHEIEIIEQELKKRATVVTAYGKTKDLEGAIDAFKTGRAQYIVANPKTLKYGVTFTNCKYVVYYSFSYSAEDYDQSHDRNYRLGQTEQCTYIYLQAADTIDEIMYAKVKYKLSSAEFFEQLIKDASKHGIDYESLKPKNDDEIKESMSDDEGAISLILNDIEKRQGKKLLEEYLNNYVAEEKEHFDWIEPSEEDVIKAFEICFKKSNEPKRNDFFRYDNMPIEDLCLSWDAYYSLKKDGIDNIGDLYELGDEAIRDCVNAYIYERIYRFNDSSYEQLNPDDICDEISLKLGEISIIMIRAYIKNSRSFSIAASNCDGVSIRELDVSELIKDKLEKYNILTVFSLRVKTMDEISAIEELSEVEIQQVRNALWKLNVSFYGDKIQKVLTQKQIEIMHSNVDELELSVRAYNGIKRAGINTVEELMQRTPEEMLNVRNLGQSAVDEIIERLSEFDLSLKGDVEYGNDKAKVLGVENIDELNIDDMGLSVRSFNCLKRAGINTLGDLTRRTPEDMMKVRNLGRKNLEEILWKMREYGVWLEGEEPPKNNLIPSDVDGMTIEEMNLTIRSYNCLKRAGIRTVADLRSRTPDDMMKVRNLGRRSLEEVIDKMKELGVEFSSGEDEEENASMPSGDIDEKISILDLGFELRTRNCLWRAGIYTLGDLVSRTPEDMMKVRNLGRKSLEEVCEKMKELGVEFASDDDEY